MTKLRKITGILAISGLSSLLLAGTSHAGGRYGPNQTNHLAPYQQPHMQTMGRQINVLPVPQGPHMGQYRGIPANHPGYFHQQNRRPRLDLGKLVPRPNNPAYKNWSDRVKGRKQLAYQIPPPPAPYGQQFQQWVEYEAQYTLYPGDQLDIVVPSAPELSRTLTVGPDGRIVMPNVEPIMAAGRTFRHVEAAISAQMATLLRDPKVSVNPRAYSPQQIFIGGEVGAQGTYAMPGPVGVTEAVLLAGGLRPTAKTGSVAVLRRAPNGGMMMRVVNLKNGMRNIREYNDNMQLRRGDIIFVPRNSLAEIGAWMGNFRSALPVDFNLSYQFGAQNGGTTVISP